MERRGVHQKNPKSCPVSAPRKASKRNKTEPEISAIVDVQVAGAQIWVNGKFADFMRNTTFDSAVGYPITTDDHDTQLNSGTVFDNVVTNPLEHDSYEDVHADEEDGIVGSLGGGGEYSTGEIIL